MVLGEYKIVLLKYYTTSIKCISAIPRTVSRKKIFFLHKCTFIFILKVRGKYTKINLYFRIEHLQKQAFYNSFLAQHLQTYYFYLELITYV